jgi:hypothetical protein
MTGRGGRLVLFARDEAKIEFQHNRLWFCAYFGIHGLFVAVKGSKVKDKAEKARAAREWFIENQGQFNLEGYA